MVITEVPDILHSGHVHVVDVQSYRGTFHHFYIEHELTRALHELGRREAAIEYYERVLSVDIRFRDTSRRIEALRAANGAGSL